MISKCNDNQTLLSPAKPSNRLTSPLPASLHTRAGAFKGATMKPIPIGKIFNRLTVLADAGQDLRSKRRVKCRCACGKETEADLYNVKSGAVKSCGCLFVEVGRACKTHGHTRKNGEHHTSPEYNSWLSMKSRCLNSSADNFKHYGGRGIIICDRWLHSFENFLSDMGTRPAGESLERKNNNGNYDPSNCIWATRKAQANNRRSNKCLSMQK